MPFVVWSDREGGSMLTEDLEKEITKLERYLIREGRKEFVLEMRQAGEEGRKAKLLSLVKYAQEIEDTKKNDEKLNRAKAEVTALSYGYNKDKSMNAKLQRFIFLVNKEDGVE